MYLPTIPLDVQIRLLTLIRDVHARYTLDADAMSLVDILPALSDDDACGDVYAALGMTIADIVLDAGGTDADIEYYFEVSASQM